MKLHIIKSGSKGNCYILEASDECLIIECGVPLFEVKKALNFDITKIVGCIVTHEHQDHCKYVKQFHEAGLEICASYGTFKEFDESIFGYKVCIISNMNMYGFGSFKVIPFDVRHDANEPLGFFIDHPESGKIVFMTDTIYSKYKFDGVNHFIIEANYCEDIIDRKLRFEGGNKFVRDRVIKSHMSLQQCIRTLKANDLNQVRNIILIHLSDTNSDEKKFKSEVEKATGKMVTVASDGLLMDLNKKPF